MSNPTNRNQPKVMPSKDDIVYVAGLLDGEGCISIVKCIRGKNWTPQYQLLVSISMTYLPLGEWLKDRFGGSCFLRQQKGNRKPNFDWQICANQALGFLGLVSPYLQVKKREADFAIAYQTQKRKNPHTKGNRGGRGRSFMPPERVRLMEEAQQYLRSLKHNSPGGIRCTNTNSVKLKQ